MVTARGQRVEGAHGQGGRGLVDLIEEEIVFGLRSPRERLVEDELMARFDAKRHAVRAALGELEHRGLVRRRPNSGVSVRDYTESEIRDIYAMRELLEVHAAGTMPRPVDEERLDELDALAQAHADAVDRHDVRAVVLANTRFHQVLFGLAANRVLADSIEHHARMSYGIRSITATDRALMERSRAEHRTMVQALRDGDLDLLAATCRRHLIPARDAYLRKLGDLAALQ